MSSAEDIAQQFINGGVVPSVFKGAAPGAHASRHITGGNDVIPNAVANGASGLMSGSDAQSLRLGIPSSITALNDKITGMLTQVVSVLNPPAPLVAAVGDGITNDTTAIQAMINYLAARGGGILLIPYKQFKVTQISITNMSNLTVTGKGELKGSGGSGVFGVVYISNSSSITIDDINISGINSGSDDRGIWVADSHNVTIKGNRITNFAQEAINLWGTSNAVEPTNHILDNYILGNNYGIRTQANTEYVEIDRNKVINNNYGIYGALGNCRVTNNKVIQNKYGIVLDASLGSNPDHSSISGNQINHNRAIGLLLQGLVSGEQVMDNQILSTVGPDVWPTTGKSHSLVLLNVKDLAFIGNRVDAPPGSTLYISGHQECRYIGNTFHGGEFKEEIAGGKNVYQGNRYLAPSKLTLHASTPKPVRMGEIEQGVFINDLSSGIIKTTLTLQNNWVVPSGYEPLCYWKNSDGNIHIQGFIDAGTLSSIVSSLPVGFRPSFAIDISGSASNSGIHASFRVYTNGNIQHLSGGNTLVSISAMFRP